MSWRTHLLPDASCCPPSWGRWQDGSCTVADVMYIHSPTLQESEVSVCFSLQSVCSQCTTSSCLRPRFRSVDDPRCICAANTDPDADLAGWRAAACVFLCLEVKSYTPILPSSLPPFYFPNFLPWRPRSLSPSHWRLEIFPWHQSAVDSKQLPSWGRLK